MKKYILAGFIIGVLIVLIKASITIAFFRSDSDESLMDSILFTV